jgi:hypothetical protein
MNQRMRDDYHYLFLTAAAIAVMMAVILLFLHFIKQVSSSHGQSSKKCPAKTSSAQAVNSNWTFKSLKSKCEVCTECA